MEEVINIYKKSPKNLFPLEQKLAYLCHAYENGADRF